MSKLFFIKHAIRILEVHNTKSVYHSEVKRSLANFPFKSEQKYVLLRYFDKIFEYDIPEWKKIN